GQSDATAHAAGESAHARVGVGLEAHSGEDVAEAWSLDRRPAEDGGEGQILGGAEVVVELGLVSDEGDQPADLVALPHEVVAPDRAPAGAVTGGGGGRPAEGGLARAVRAEHGGDRSRGYGEAHPAQGGLRPVELREPVEALRDAGRPAR